MNKTIGQGSGDRGSLRANGDLCGFAALLCGQPAAFRQVVQALNLHLLCRLRDGKAQPFHTAGRRSRKFRESHRLAKAAAPVALCAAVCLALPRMLPADDAATRGRPTLKSIGDKVYCLCGCVTTLNRCPHLPSECSSRAQMEQAINAGIAQGKDEPAILQDLTARYGVQVLAAPPAKGFDLTVWVLPGFGLIVGLVVVIAIVRRWRRPPPGPPSGPPPADPKVMAAIEEEMKTLSD